MPVLELKNIRKSFGETDVLKGINLSVEQGEFVTLLGSSGCGKTTTLRIIAGLESPESGEVILSTQNVTNFAPNKRDVNTVFQNYALFPHMNVEQNIGYSLKIKNVPKNEIKTRVKEMLELIQLEEYGNRMPNELSGGQKQRVAIARSLIARPKILLLDEPLGALDLQLRRQMQTELKKLQVKLGISFIYITHDQEEAINMSDRIVVMKNGEFEQIGSADDVYNKPKTAYVAEFVGSSNIIKGTAKIEGDFVRVTNEDGNVLIKKDNFNINDGDTALIALRSEQIVLVKDNDRIANEGLLCTVSEKSFNGGMLRIALCTKGGEVVARKHGIDADVKVGDSLYITFDPNNAVLVEE